MQNKNFVTTFLLKFTKAMRNAILLVCWSMMFQCVFAQNPSISGTSGAINTAMAGIGASVANEWAIFNNIGALSAYQNILPSAMLSFENRFGIKALNSYHFGIISPIAFGGVGGMTFQRFGDKHFNQTQVGIGYSHQISLVSVGAKVNYFQIAVDDQIGVTQGARSNFLLELGGLAQLSKKWAVGIYGYNFTQSKLRVLDAGEDRIPVILKAGVSYQPIEAVFLSLETEKHIDYPATFRAGLNYRIHKYFYVRTGISTEPFLSAFGIGFHPKDFAFDYALNNQSALGWVHQFSIRYALRKLKLREEKINE